ncbi:MAG: hypothetical protein ACPGXK_09545 [Phycisphaerae bacterium]
MTDTPVKDDSQVQGGEAVCEEQQFCVGLAHRPGMLTQLCKRLRDGGVNIEALFVSNDEEAAWVNFVGTPHDKVKELLDADGYRWFTESVLTVPAHNQPGEIERIAAKLADATVNINFIYGSGAPGYPSKIVLGTDDLAAARAALAG